MTVRAWGYGGKMNEFGKRIKSVAGAGLFAGGLNTLQVNIGLLCNNRCKHCHLEAGPEKKELMDWHTMQLVIAAARDIRPNLVDITGGAPEMNPNLKRFVKAMSREGFRVQIRTNLTILTEPGMKPMIDFFKQNKVKLVASLPCYLKKEVDSIRGDSAFDRSVEALRNINKAGYGRASELQLDLVFNPEGDFLPADQSLLEQEYRETLSKEYDIDFDNLITIANMPIGRFNAMLRRKGTLQSYNRLLRKAFNNETIDGLMCRSQISVGWDGKVYDCDFNLALGLTVDDSVPQHIRDCDQKLYSHRRIVTGNHCFGCTAGQGSSCEGALVR
jgi:radical SAM/Cys-rich protein